MLRMLSQYASRAQLRSATQPTHRPEVASHAGAPLEHCASTVQFSMRVPLLVAPALCATTIWLPGSKTAVDEHVQVRSGRTMVRQRVCVPDVTVTLWPGTPVPDTDGVAAVVVPVPLAGGETRLTLPATHRRAVVS